jgi:hypothetical protein
MAQTSENIASRVLEEFVVSAHVIDEPTNSSVDQLSKESLRDLVVRVASEMAIPQYNLGEVADKVLSIVVPQIEERVRNELEEQLQRQQQSYNDSFIG